MAVNPMQNYSRQAITIYRRRQVAALILRGLSQREVRAALTEKAIINPKSLKPWSIGVINKDVKRLRKEWAEAAAQDIAEYKAGVLAELQEVKRAAWTERQYRLVLKALEQECRLLGLDKPVGIDITSGGDRINIREVIVELNPEGDGE